MAGPGLGPVTKLHMNRARWARYRARRALAHYGISHPTARMWLALAALTAAWAYRAGHHVDELHS